MTSLGAPIRMYGFQYSCRILSGTFHHEVIVDNIDTLQTRETTAGVHVLNNSTNAVKLDILPSLEAMQQLHIRGGL